LTFGVFQTLLLSSPMSGKMRVTRDSSVPLVILLLSAVCFSQSPSSHCDANKSAPEGCTSLAQPEPVHDQVSMARSLLDRRAELAESSEAATDSKPAAEKTTADALAPETEGFHWGRALTESFTFLIIEQGFVVHTDFNWVVSENGIPFNHYWRDYTQSLTTWWHAGWSAGEEPLYNYVGHPIQGALTAYIQIQNDPKSEKLEFANTKAYWRSRLKATLWNAVYSTQWSIGPFSEMTVEKYGSKDRPPWNANGSFPCNTKTCYAGVGKVNLVMTPVGGFGWMLAEDVLDKKITEQLVESHTQNRLLIDTVRTALNPIRGGANILHGKRVWYRARDAHGAMNVLNTTSTSARGLFSQREAAVSASEVPKPDPSQGNIFFGYSHLGPSHCEAIFSSVGIVCDPLSAKVSNLSGWNVSLENKYFRYFGAVADFSGQYGSASQGDFLFGIRGGASIGMFRPFAQVLFGGVHAWENSTGVVKSDTTFAEDLGAGIDFRLTRLLSWRTQADALKTGSPTFKRYNVHVSTGLVVRF
jgi:hypothetical protein